MPCRIAAGKIPIAGCSASDQGLFSNAGKYSGTEGDEDRHAEAVGYTESPRVVLRQFGRQILVGESMGVQRPGQVESETENN
ncbi:MAG: hypothetical protein R3C24_08495 [Cyanobacteriota/Melainabacteria group bacterium]